MPYRAYPPATPSLVVRDPVVDLAPDHLARLVDQLVDEAVSPPPRLPGRGQPPYDPRLCLKVLVYGYATGVRSSRRLEQLCEESLPYLLLTRGDTPCYHTLCTARLEQSKAMEQVFAALFVLAASLGMKRLGHLVVDSTKLRAHASPDAVLRQPEYEAVRQELERILQEAKEADARESREGARATLLLGERVATEQMRDIVRRVRYAQRKAQQPPPTGEAAASPVDLAPAAASSMAEETTAKKGGSRPRRRRVRG